MQHAQVYTQCRTATLAILTAQTVFTDDNGQFSRVNIDRIRIGDYTAVTFWNGPHPADTYDMTEIGPEFWEPIPPPPLYLEYVIAHEFFHASQHVHMDDGGPGVGEEQAREWGNYCAGTNF